MLALGSQLQRRPAAREDDHQGQTRQQVVELERRVDHVLEVVEDQEPGGVAEVLDQQVEQGVPTR